MPFILGSCVPELPACGRQFSNQYISPDCRRVRVRHVQFQYIIIWTPAYHNFLSFAIFVLVLHQFQYSVLLKLLLNRPNCSNFSGDSATGPMLISVYLLQPLISHQSQYSVLLKLLLDRPNCSKFSGGSASPPLDPC
jgi:hypothetical protein